MGAKAALAAEERRWKQMVSDIPTDLQVLVGSYIETTTEHLEKLDQAVRAGLAEEVERIAHRCSGCSDMFGIKALVGPLRRLERLGRQRQLGQADKVLLQTRKEWERLKQYLCTLRDKTIKHGV